MADALIDKIRQAIADVRAQGFMPAHVVLPPDLTPHEVATIRSLLNTNADEANRGTA